MFLPQKHCYTMATLLWWQLLFIAAGLLRSRYPDNKYLRVLSVFFITSYILWCVEFHVYRYALPLEMLSGIIIIALLKPLFKTYRLFLLALVMLGLYFLVSTVPPKWGVRQHLQADYLALQAPAVPDDAVIVLLTRPFTYVIPFFNPTAHFVGITFIGLGFAPQEKNDSLLYQKTIRVLRDAGRKNKLYGLSYVNDDLVSTLSYSLLLNRKIGPTLSSRQASTVVLMRMDDPTSVASMWHARCRLLSYPSSHGEKAPLARHALQLAAPSSNARPEPATRSFTVWRREPRGACRTATRAPMFTAMPAILPSASSHSPV